MDDENQKTIQEIQKILEDDELKDISVIESKKEIIIPDIPQEDNSFLNATKTFEVAKEKNYPREFEIYVIWKSLPHLLRGKSSEQLEKLGYVGYDDGILGEIMHIKTKTEFASHFGIKQMRTLINWDNTIDKHSLLFDAVKHWSKRLSANVMASLYKNILRDGDAPRIKLWLQIVEEWEEKTKTDVGFSQELKELVEKINGVIQQK